jgi:hypothetical protein
MNALVAAKCDVRLNGMQMNMETLKLAWDVVSGVAIAAWTVFLPFRSWIKPRLDQWRYGRPSGGQRVAKDLRRIAKILWRMELSLRRSTDELITGTRSEIAKVRHRVLNESLSYLAIFSKRDAHRCSAIRALSQVQDPEKIERVRRILQGIAAHPNTPADVNRVVQAALAELEERQKRTRGRGGPSGEKKPPLPEHAAS